MRIFKLLLIITLLCASGFAKAQDVIVKKDSSTILSKVTKIGETEIEYKKWSNLDGPTYVINASEVISINFENGEVEKFENVSNTPIVIQQHNDSQKGYMERDGNGLTLNGRKLSDEEVRTLVGEENYKTYMSAKAQISQGRVNTALFIITLTGTVCLATMAGLNNDPDLLTLAYVTGAIADISLPLMCILKGAGKGRMNWVADEYNRKNQSYSYSYSLSPSIMASKTPQLQNTYGLGLTFSMNF